MHIYSLTSIGKKLARSISAPDSPAYRIIHFLDQQGQSTTEQIAEFCNLSSSEASGLLGTLKRKRVVIEVSGMKI